MRTRTTILLLLSALPLMLSSCATPQPPQVFHQTDESALIVQTFDNRTCEILAPTPLGRAENAHALNLAGALAQHQTAVVILENFSEPRLGPEFRDRTFAWFLGLRGLGYEHIVFLQGADVPDPEHLITLAKYD